jgi:uncharacterized DUF497 family protein
VDDSQGGDLHSLTASGPDAGRPLFVVFTLRGERVRIISARDMTRRERKEYESAQAQEPPADPAL